MRKLLFVFSLWWVWWVFSPPTQLVRSQAITVLTVSPLHQYKTISQALTQAKTLNSQNISVRVDVYPGTYRETLVYQNSTNAILELVSIVPHGAIISGADVYQFTRQSNGDYVATWGFDWGLSPIPQSWIQNGLNVEVKDIVRRRELVLIDGVRYQQVLNASELTPGKFYVNETVNTITVRPNGTINAPIEVGVRQRTVDFYRTNNVTITGLVFEGAASHFDQSGANFNESTNLRLFNNIFRKNGAGGAGISRSDGLETRSNVFNDNGMTGFGGAYNHNYLSVSDTACGNNWRGYSGGFIGWSVAGVKHLHQRNARYENLTVCKNLAHGFWADTDMENVVIDGLSSYENINAGVYIEAIQGPFEITNSSITNNEQKGLYISSVHNLIVRNTTISGNKREAQVYIGGSVPTRTSWNHVTGQNFTLYPAQNIRFYNNTFIGLSEQVPAFWYVTGQLNEQFIPTYLGDFNVWRNVNNSRPIRLGNNFPTWYNLTSWQNLSKQDLNSTTVEPTNTPIPSETPAPTDVPTDVPTLTNTPPPTLTLVLTPTNVRYKIIFGGELWWEFIEVEE